MPICVFLSTPAFSSISRQSTTRFNGGRTELRRMSMAWPNGISGVNAAGLSVDGCAGPKRGGASTICCWGAAGSRGPRTVSCPGSVIRSAPLDAAVARARTPRKIKPFRAVLNWLVPFSLSISSSPTRRFIYFCDEGYSTGSIYLTQPEGSTFQFE